MLRLEPGPGLCWVGFAGSLAACRHADMQHEARVGEDYAVRLSRPRVSPCEAQAWLPGSFWRSKAGAFVTLFVLLPKLLSALSGPISNGQIYTLTCRVVRHQC